MAKILVCDDEPDILALVRGRLERAGHQVITAINGTEGLQLALTEGPDLVILDWLMPDLTGLEICIALRAHPDTATKKLLMLTSRGQRHDLQSAFDAGIDDYLLKPFRPGTLEDTVAALLQRA